MTTEVPFLGLEDQVIVIPSDLFKKQSIGSMSVTGKLLSSKSDPLKWLANPPRLIGLQLLPEQFLNAEHHYDGI